MALAEDSNKVDNIVSGSMGLLQDIYTKAILKHDTFNEVTPPLTTGRSRSTDELQMPSLSTQQRWVASLPAVRFTSLTHVGCWHQISTTLEQL